MKRGRKVRRGESPPKKRRSAAKRKTPKRKTPKRKAPKRKTPKRKTPKRKAPKRKTPKRKAPKRKSLPLTIISRALRSAKKVFDAQGFSHDLPGWQPAGGWQGDAVAEEVSYMTHEEKIDWMEWLAEKLDTTISELFDKWGST